MCVGKKRARLAEDMGELQIVPLQCLPTGCGEIRGSVLAPGMWMAELGYGAGEGRRREGEGLITRRGGRWLLSLKGFQ